MPDNDAIENNGNPFQKPGVAGNPFAVATSPVDYARSPAENTGGWKSLLLLIGLGLAAAALCSMLGGQPPTLVSIPVVSVTIWLCSLSGFWIAFGNHPVRFITAPIPFLNAFYLDWLAGGSEFVALTCFFVGILIVVAITGFGMRVLFGELRRDVGLDAKDALQFDLRHLFVLMTFVAAVFGIGKALLAAEIWNPASNVAVIVTILVVAISTMTLISIWATLGQKLSVTRLIVVCLAILAAAAATGIAVRGGAGAEFWVPAVLLEQMLMLGALICVRVERYRFVQVEKTSAT